MVTTTYVHRLRTRQLKFQVWQDPHSALKPCSSDSHTNHRKLPTKTQECGVEMKCVNAV